MPQTKNKPVSVVAETNYEKGDTGSFSHLPASSKSKSNSIITQLSKKSSTNCKNYLPDIFAQIKNTLDIITVAEYYGVQVNSKGFALCPFHGEKTPSFKINSSNNTFHCFGCGAHGTVVDFVMILFNLKSIEAAERLNQDFGLNLSADESAKPEIILLMQKNRELINDFREWEKKAFRTVADYFKALRFWGEQIFVHQNKYFEKYLEDVENIVWVEILVDLMIENTNDFQAQVEFFRNFGEAVRAIEYRLKK